jgi:aminoglycoside phosphotransferase (APT) family kinase protein
MTQTFSTPAAEVDVGLDLVRRLLASQHPDLAELPLELMANGWDNVMCRLGTDLLVRLPRREMGGRLVRHEQRWLPVLAPRLPLPVPAPVRIGLPADGYPWSWSIVPSLPGQVAGITPPADPASAATTLGAFLRALHTPAPEDAPVNPVRGVPLSARGDAVASNMTILGDRIDRETVQARWDEALRVPAWDGPPLWLHGDLHPANILVHDGRISGVIDFGDITSGDPATDLAVAWSLIAAEHRETFWAAYGPQADEATRRRAKGWALAFSLVYLAYSADNPLLEQMGRHTHAAVLADQ